MLVNIGQVEDAVEDDMRGLLPANRIKLGKDHREAQDHITLDRRLRESLKKQGA